MLVVPSGVDGVEVIRLTHRCPEGPLTKSGREIMEILEAFDLTGTAWSAAQLTGCDAKTVARYVAARDAGGDPLARAVRAAAPLNPLTVRSRASPGCPVGGFTASPIGGRVHARARAVSIPGHPGARIGHSLQ
jgi:hypothetical protein